MELERFLGELPHIPSLSKQDRYSLLLHARSLTFDAIGIKMALQGMQRDGIKPSNEALRALLHYHVESGDFEGAERFCLDELPRYGQGGLDSYMVCTLLTGWGRAGLVERAERLFAMVPEHHNSCPLITTMINVYMRVGKFGQAIDLYSRFGHMGDSVLLKVMVKCYYLNGQNSQALRLWSRIAKWETAMDWLDIANFFLDKGEYEQTARMAIDSVEKFGLVKGIPEVATAVIEKSDSEKTTLVSDLYKLLWQAASGKLNLLAKPFTAYVDHCIRNNDQATLTWLSEQHQQVLKQHFSHTDNLRIHSKISIFNEQVH